MLSGDGSRCPGSGPPSAHILCFTAPGRVRKPALVLPAPSLQVGRSPLALLPSELRSQVRTAFGGPTLPAPLRGQVLTSTIGLDLSPRWSRPAFSGRGPGEGRPWAPAFQSGSADRGPPSPQPGGRGRSPSRDPSPVWSGPLGSRARWPQGTARAAWDARGAWHPASLWREQKEAKQGSSLFGCQAPALPASSPSGSSSRETGNSPAGLENATSLRAPATSPLPGFPWRLGPGRTRGQSRPGLPVGPLGPTGSLLAERAPARRARMGVMGRKPRTGSFPCLCWKMAAAEATPPAATGEPGAARRASQAPRTACLPLEGTLELCGPQAGHGAGTERPGCPRPTPPATTGLPWFAPHTQGPQAALEMIPLGGTVAPEMRPPWRAWPLPPPFVTEKRPREAPGATPASRVGLAPLGCWGSWCVCFGLLVGSPSVPKEDIPGTARPRGSLSLSLLWGGRVEVPPPGEEGACIVRAPAHGYPWGSSGAQPQLSRGTDSGVWPCLPSPPGIPCLSSALPGPPPPLA